MTRGDSRGRSVVALGFFLARRGLTAALGLALTVVCAAGFVALAVHAARHGRPEMLAEVPLLASSALAFGVGVLVAFAASTRAFRRDEDEGIRALLESRGIRAGGYLLSRVAGLAASLACLVGGGSALVGLVAILAARGRTVALHTAQTSLAAILFSLAFAVTFAPVAMATLGARSRLGGYLALLAVLVIPEIVQASLGRLVAPGWLEVCSIPGALLALRSALCPATASLLTLLRALAALVAIIFAALVVIRAELVRDAGTPLPSGRRPT